ncbi:MAG: alpha/beta hydrolase [Armatimonadetes bacterium]|nr:alpha/beta hydrolase [Armatimonadota bacterium]
MPFLCLSGCDLYYEAHGSGPAVVFAHGLGGNHLSWWQQVPHFRDRYTCIAFAHRGFAPSVEAPGGPGPAAFVDDLAALIGHLDLPDVRLVAQSMGGWTCLGYALRHPEKVRALVMACTTGSLKHPEVERLASLTPESTRDDLLARGIHPAAGERMARELPALHFLYREIDGLSVGLDKMKIRAALRTLRTTPAERVAGLRVPVLCLTGEEDAVMPPDAVAVLASLIPGARLERVPKAGHSVYFERPEIFNRLVDDFLKAAGT